MEGVAKVSARFRVRLRQVL